MKALPAATDDHEQHIGVRLYRDDLERIVSLMTEAGLSVTIKDSSFAYDSLDELFRVRGTSPDSFSIAGNGPSGADARVKKSGRYWYVSTSGDGTAPLMRGRQTKVEHLPLHWMWQTANALLLVGLALVKPLPQTATVLVATGTLGLLGCGLLTLYWRIYPKAILSYKHEAGFLARNRNQLLLLAVGAVLGGIVKAAFDFLTKAGTTKVAP